MHKAIATRGKILDAASFLARYGNVYAITMREIADKAEINHSLIAHHYGSIDNLRDAVVSKAIESEDAVIVMQAIFHKQVDVTHLSHRVRLSVLDYVKAVLDL